MVKGVEQTYRGNRTLQLSLTETEAFLLDAVLANVQRSNTGPQARLSDIGDAISDFLEGSPEDLEDIVQAKFPDNIVGTFEMEFDFDKKGLHFPEIRKEAPKNTTDTGSIYGYAHDPHDQSRDDEIVKERLENASERRIFYVDMGNMPSYKADEVIRAVKEQYGSKPKLKSEDGFTEVPGYGYIPD